IATAVSSGNAIVLFTGTFYGPNWASLEPARTFERTLKIVTIVTNVWKFDVCWSSPRDPRGQAYAPRTRHWRLTLRPVDGMARLRPMPHLGAEERRESSHRRSDQPRDHRRAKARGTRGLRRPAERLP